MKKVIVIIGSNIYEVKEGVYNALKCNLENERISRYKVLVDFEAENKENRKFKSCQIINIKSHAI